MKEEKNLSSLKINSRTKQQIQKCLTLVNKILGPDLLGIYLYGSALVGGLERYSDLDLFVVCTRPTTKDEKAKLVKELLHISGIYMKSEELPIEMTIVEKSQVNPWRYPPHFDFQYGEWLREEFKQGNLEPWETKEMPDLALLITQVLLASTTLVGAGPEVLLCNVPYKDFINAVKHSLPSLLSELESDTRNVLLTLARIWSTLATDQIRSKPAAANWVIKHLPEKLQPVMNRARAICKGEENEHWGDIQDIIKPCAEFIFNQANMCLAQGAKAGDFERKITIASAAQ